MNILFLTLVKITDIDDRGIYTDLLRKFKNEGHSVSIVSPTERREKIKTNIKRTSDGVSYLNVKTFNLQKTNIVEKGIGTLAIENQFLKAIKKHLNQTKFDLVLYSTPPITFTKVIEHIKNKDSAYAYLLLKDIFPQNAVDMGYLKNGGILHKLFLKKERQLYEVSDMIGCMSEANKEYILKHNSWIPPKKIEVNPNSIYPIQIDVNQQEITELRQKYEIPLEKTVFVYGGNLGKPQGVDFLLEVIQETKNENVFFLIVGSGTEYNRIKNWFSKYQPSNARLLSGLPKNEYDKILATCDVGLIFLNKNFTIPNFPSRMLSYLEMGKPIIAAVDTVTDIGDVIEKNGCGISVVSGDFKGMELAIENSLKEDLTCQMKKQALDLLYKDYHVDFSYSLIIDKL